MFTCSDQESPETGPEFPTDDVGSYSVSDWLNLGFEFSHTDIDQSDSCGATSVESTNQSPVELSSVELLEPSLTTLERGKN